jgi:hypothetical protein
MTEALTRTQNAPVKAGACAGSGDDGVGAFQSSAAPDEGVFSQIRQDIPGYPYEER